MNIVLFGPPGAGKGTQSDKIANKFNLLKVSSGDLLRNKINKESKSSNTIKSSIDRGFLAPDEIINKLVENIVSDQKYSNKLIFDGYPRNITQVKNLDLLLKKYNQKLSCVLSLKVDNEIIIKRKLGRQTCSKCNLIFNRFFNPANDTNHPCGSHFLTKRADDNEETIKSRLDIYYKETLPVLNYYKSQNLWTEIDGMNEINHIYEEIEEFISSLKA